MQSVGLVVAKLIAPNRFGNELYCNNFGRNGTHLKHGDEPVGFMRLWR